MAVANDSSVLGSSVGAATDARTAVPGGLEATSATTAVIASLEVLDSALALGDV
jgi:hypothetical protein